MVRNTFFQSSTQNEHAEKNFVINFGDTGDSCFRAVAGSILFHFSKNNAIINDAVLHSIMQEFYKYYPNFKPSSGLNPKTHIHTLLIHQKIESLVIKFAYVLRRMALNYMEQQASQFLMAFTNTSLEEMGKPNTKIDESIIAAIAEILNLSIEVRYSQNHMSLPASHIYNEHTQGSKITLLREHETFNALVNGTNNEIEKFKGIRTVYSAQEFAPSNVNVDDNIEARQKTINNNIKEYKFRVNQQYKRVRDNLVLKVQNKVLNKEKLLNMYIKALSTDTYLLKRHNATIKDSGNTAFFSNILTKDNNAVTISTNKMVVGERQNLTDDNTVIDELIQAIARTCAIDNVNLTELLESVEEDIRVTQRISNRQSAAEESGDDLTVSAPISSR